MNNSYFSLTRYRKVLRKPLEAQVFRRIPCCGVRRSQRLFRVLSAVDIQAEDPGLPENFEKFSVTQKTCIPIQKHTPRCLLHLQKRRSPGSMERYHFWSYCTGERGAHVPLPNEKKDERGSTPAKYLRGVEGTFTPARAAYCVSFIFLFGGYVKSKKKNTFTSWPGYRIARLQKTISFFSSTSAG